MKQMTAKEYFEMATANTIVTRFQVSAEECIVLMQDYAELFSSQLEPQISKKNGKHYIANAIKTIQYYYPNSKIIEILLPKENQEEVERFLTNKCTFTTREL